MLKQLFFITAVAGLTACGTGSGDSGSKISGTGECAKIASVSLHQKTKVKIVAPNTFGYAFYEIIEKDNKHVVTETTSDGTKMISEIQYYIKGNVLYPTKLIFKMDGMTTTATSSPHGVRHVVNEVCDGSAWEDTMTTTYTSTSGDGSSEGNKTTIKSKIEGINIAKTVEAGEFNTYIIRMDGRHENSSNWDRLWVDMETGMEVLRETYDSAGKVLISWELVDYSN